MEKNRFRRCALYQALLICGTTAATETIAQSASARGDDRLNNMEIIIVQGSQHTHAPDRLENDAILSVAPQGLTDVLKLSPEVDVGGPRPNATRYYLRGLEATTLAVTFDGVPSAGDLFQHRGAVSIIDPALIDSVTVKTAPVAAGDGPAALGGALEIRSVSLDDLLSEEKPGLFGVSFSGASTNDALGSSATTAYRLSDTVSAVAFASYQDFDDYKDGKGNTVSLSASENTSGYMKVQFQPSADHTFDVSALYGKNAGLLPYGAGDLPTEFYERQYSQGRAGGGPVRQSLEELSLSARYQGSGPGSPYALIYAADSTLADKDHGDAHTQMRYGGRFTLTFDRSIGDIHTVITTGIDGRLEQYKTEYQGSDNENDAVTAGLFADVNFDLGSLQLNSGLRAEYLQTDYDEKSFDHIQLSPSLRGTFALTPQLALFAGYGLAYRATNTLPASRAGRTSGKTIFPHKGLRPEQARQASLGANFTWDAPFSQDGQLFVEVEGFEVHLRDVVVFEGGARGAPFRQVFNASGDYTSQGVSATIGWMGSRLRSTLALSLVALNDPDGTPVLEVRSLAAARGDRLRWNNEVELGKGFRLGYIMTAVEDLTRLPEGITPKAGYVVHDTRIDWSSDNGTFSVALVARNLTDEFYIDQTSFTYGGFAGVPEPGRDIRIEARASF
ncbi:TonB-dependent receptor [Microbulbifer sp. 2304DJ12-6]|uniref:TonB-dependent receptor n=1 Tax=Microbulbifer sp. 2304DJ12-6 TaxID=3233340 RepID=UPI0039B0A690